MHHEFVQHFKFELQKRQLNFSINKTLKSKLIS